jgi:hypothetical protein
VTVGEAVWLGERACVKLWLDVDAPLLDKVALLDCACDRVPEPDSLGVPRPEAVAVSLAETIWLELCVCVAVCEAVAWCDPDIVPDGLAPCVAVWLVESAWLEVGICDSVSAWLVVGDIDWLAEGGCVTDAVTVEEGVALAVREPDEVRVKDAVVLAVLLTLWDAELDCVGVAVRVRPVVEVSDADWLELGPCEPVGATLGVPDVDTDVDSLGVCVTLTVAVNEGVCEECCEMDWLSLGVAVPVIEAVSLVLCVCVREGVALCDGLRDCDTVGAPLEVSDRLEVPDKDGLGDPDPVLVTDDVA